MRRLLWIMPTVGALGCAALLSMGGLVSANNAVEANLNTVTELPIGRAVLFSSGVGYFQREGFVEGDTRVDLSFHERDINDLLKSMVLMDEGGGSIAAVSYDSTEPVERTLSSFAVNLNGSPGLMGILSQARGEKVEVVLNQTAVGQPANLTGSIVGCETKSVPVGEAIVQAECLNLLCADGMRSVMLPDVQRLRFSDPNIEEEFRRALEVLSESHDQQDKSVNLVFAGEGRRQVKVGYVVEHPLWKTSYRLVIDSKGAEPPFLQGWAMVENPTDEDWAGVQMALVSGRPISFRMDLYDPLYVQRPLVEPELFASLRPPTYQRQLLGFDDASGSGPMSGNGQPANGRQGGDRMDGAKYYFDAPAAESEQLRLAEPTQANREAAGRYLEELQKQMPVQQGVASSATASQLGDYFQYVVDRPVDLPRQKSAMLPIINKALEAERVSIYNQSVQATHPLLGLRVKNTTGSHLMQGPVTVFEGSVYAGDTRWLDVQPGEERLVSYAIDLGSEVDPKNGKDSTQVMSVKAVKGVIYTTNKRVDEQIYTIKNASETDRVVLVEHPNRKGQQFEVVSEEKPIEETADFYRFKVSVPAGQSKTLSVVEERKEGTSVALSNSNDEQIRQVIRLDQASPALKQALQTSLELKGAWDDVQREIATAQTRIQTITADQERLRGNLREMPREAKAYDRYLKKLDDQEQEMDALHEKLKQLQKEEHEKRVQYEDYLRNLTIE